MNKNKKYFDLVQTGDDADVTIFGDITSWPYLNSDVSSYNLAQLIKNIPDTTKNINVHINSYGGEVAEGLAIYNSLKNHQANVTTIVDGFACSAASIIFMAGDDRIMNKSSLLMIHNALMMTGGNSDQLRKDADDLDIMNDQIVKAYLGKVNIIEDDVRKLMNDESWIAPENAVKWGFATSIEESGENNNPENSTRKLIFDQLVHPTGKKVSVPSDNESKIDDDMIKSIIEKLKGFDLSANTADKHPTPVDKVPGEEGNKQPNDMLDCFLYAVQSNSKNEREEK